MDASTPRRREADLNLSCRIARHASEAWDFVDKRDIDKHAVTMAILAGTWEITRWAMNFAHTGDRPGLEVAAIIGAVVAPYMGLQAAAIAWYFKARTE